MKENVFGGDADFHQKQNPYWVSFVAVHAKKNGFGKEKPII